MSLPTSKSTIFLFLLPFIFIPKSLIFTLLSVNSRSTKMRQFVPYLIYISVTLQRGEVQLGEKKFLFFTLIGARIRYYRKLSGLGQAELAKRVGISESTLRRIEQGTYNQNVSLTTLIDIADGLRIDVQLLLTINDDEKRLLGWK